VISRPTGGGLLVVATVIVVTAALLAPRIPQPQSYHLFADARGWLGIPNFGDVASNVAFAVVGVWGLLVLVRKTNSVNFVDSLERWPYVVVFAGFMFTAFGSAYYHMVPDNARLAWDRLPMTIVFAGIVAALIAERLSVRLGVALLPFLSAIGVASVLQWRASELRGAGDLRFYAAVQIYAMLFVCLAMLLPARYTRSWDWGVAGGYYLLAKVLETADRQVFSLAHLVSGHTLKHMAAAAAGYWILRMLEKRKPLPARIAG
jgi:hypothetical protein